MKQALRTGVTALAVLGGLSVFAAGAMAATFDVTVYNLTKGQIFSPPVVAAHARDVAIFEVGEPASDSLAKVAEDADSDDLVADLTAAGANVEVGGGVILPGGHATVRITVTHGNREISVVGMLVTTNDAFYALNGARPRGRTNSFRVPAYDAGSEENNEDCDFIPGPPCGNPFVRATADAEGFVHIHNGVHGLDDLAPEDHDWHNPVAKIAVTRVGGHGDDGEEDED